MSLENCKYCNSVCRAIWIEFVGTSNSCLKYEYLTLRTRNGTFHQEWVLKEAFSQSAGDQRSLNNITS